MINNRDAFGALEDKSFHKLIIGAALKDFNEIEHYAYLFTHAQAEVIDISAFPHSVISAKQGIKQAQDEDPSLKAPLIMVSVNIGDDPHFRRIELNEENCTECELCVPTCPSEAFSLDKGFKYNIDLCFGCSACLPSCNFEALSFEKWDAFKPESLNELIKLGASAIEIHLNNDLEAFEEFYKSMPSKFLLESFCIGSKQMNKEELESATKRIVKACSDYRDKDHKFIIQADGIPQSGARDIEDLQERKDLYSINNAETIIQTIESGLNTDGSGSKEFHEKIFIQLAGGINEQSLAFAKSKGINISGVAIGSYARKKLKSEASKDRQIQLAKAILTNSKGLSEN